MWEIVLGVGVKFGSCSRMTGKHGTAAVCEEFGLQVTFTSDFCDALLQKPKVEVDAKFDDVGSHIFNCTFTPPMFAC